MNLHHTILVNTITLIQLSGDIGHADVDLLSRIAGRLQVSAPDGMLQEPTVRSPVRWVQARCSDIAQCLDLGFRTRTHYGIAQSSLDLISRISAFR
jgi:hypothetical protein